MDFLIGVLAVAGVTAVLVRLARAGFHALVRGVDSYVRGEAVQLKARHGDLTGMADAERALVDARRRKRAGLVRLGLWGALLVVPILTPWTAPIYAAYAVLWLETWLRGTRIGKRPQPPAR